MLVGLLYDCICLIYLSNVVVFVSYSYFYLSLLFVFVQFMQFAISRRWPALGQTCGAKVQVADFRALTQLLTDRRATLKVKAGAVFLKTGEKRNTVIKSNVKKSLIRVSCVSVENIQQTRKDRRGGLTQRWQQ